MITARRVDAPTESLLDPEAGRWREAAERALALAPAPLASQPSEYVRAAWAEAPYGAVTEVRVSALHNGESLLLRLAWADDSRDDAVTDTDLFVDAAAVLFPLRGDALISNMGSPEQPVNAWYWRPDLEQPINVTATGIGSTVRHPDGSLQAASRYARRSWALVIARPFAVPGEAAVALAPGQPAKVGVALWQGSNQERAGIKGYTPEWEPLEIEA